jgi:hypothetical protein
MARVPDSKEFARLFRGMDLPTRARLSRDARRGKVGENPEEAALLAATAQRELRLTRWTMVLMGALGSLNIITALVTDSIVRWTSLGAAVLALIGIFVVLARARPLSRNEALNRERGQGPA